MERSDDEFIQQLADGPIDRELPSRELAMLRAYLKNNRPTLQEMRDGDPQRLKLKRLVNFNLDLLNQATEINQLMPGAPSAPFVYTMRKASNLSALSLGEAHHRDIVLTANAKIIHHATDLGFQINSAHTDAMNRMRAAAYVVGRLVGTTGETYETVEGWAVDYALSRLVGPPNSDADDLRHFLELTTEIRARIEGNPDDWWNNVFNLTQKLETLRKQIYPDIEIGFLLTRDERISSKAAKAMQAIHDLEPGAVTQDTTGYIYHVPARPMTRDRQIEGRVLSMTLLWYCDPYQCSASVSLIESLEGQLGEELSATRVFPCTDEAIRNLDPWIRFVNNRLNEVPVMPDIQPIAGSANDISKPLPSQKQTMADRQAKFDAAIAGYGSRKWSRDELLTNKAWRVRAGQQKGELFGSGSSERGWYKARGGERVIRKDGEGIWVYLTESHNEKLPIFFQEYML